MENTVDKPALYWYGIVNDRGQITFHLYFLNEEGDVSGEQFITAICNARKEHFPVVCLN